MKKLREVKKLTLREVAEELGIDTSTLGKIEKNKRRPSKKLILKIAKFYDVSEKDLIIDFLSDAVAVQVMYDNEIAQDVLKVAEEKVRYLQDQMKPNK